MACIHGYEVPFQAANEPDEERRNPSEPSEEISAQCRRGDHLICPEPISCDCDCHDDEVCPPCRRGDHVGCLELGCACECDCDVQGEDGEPKCGN